MKFTVLGAGGFIGSNLATYLSAQGHECFTPSRDDASIYSANLGHVIYCIGLTADFRTRPFDTVRAHVSVLADVLEKSQFDSLLYLSSTRVYGNSTEANEEAILQASPQNPSDLYNLSKMMGESLCFSCSRSNVRVVRLSNVFGHDLDSDNFLASVARDAVKHHKVVVNSSPQSVRDYVYIADVVSLLPKIAATGKARLYNLASGVNTSHQVLLAEIQAITGCEVIFMENAPTVYFPPICTDLVTNEFGFSSQLLKNSLTKVVRFYKHALTQEN